MEALEGSRPRRGPSNDDKLDAHPELWPRSRSCEPPGRTRTSGDPVGDRILSLPHIMCRAANGDLFMMELGDVQALLLKKRLGPLAEGCTTGSLGRRRGLSASADFSGSVAASGLLRAAAPRTDEDHQGALDKKHVKVESLPMLPGVQDSESYMLDEEVLRHLQLTNAIVDGHRAELQGQKEAAAKKAQDEKVTLENQAKEEAAVKVGSKWKHNAKLRRHSKEIVELLNHNDKNEKLNGSWSSKWGTVQEVVNLNLKQWSENASGGRSRWPQAKASWDQLIYLGDVYTKRRQGGQGAAVYETKCLELGVTPSTQVLQQIVQEEANLAHCKLGRLGATALSHALACNTVMRSLDLSDNALDAKAISEVLRGLSIATGARMTSKQRDVDRRMLSISRKALGVGIPVMPLSSTGHPLSPTGVRTMKESRIGLQGSPPKSPGPPASAWVQVDLQGESDPALTPRMFDRPGAPPSDSTGSAPVEPTKSVMWKSQHSKEEEGQVGRTTAKPVLEVSKGSPGLPENKSLTDLVYSGIEELDLSENPFGVGGAKILADILDPEKSPHQFLTRLALNKCNITEAGGLHLIGALKNSNLSLCSLSLSNNYLGNKTGAAIGQLLESNHTLRELDLSWNQIKPEGATALSRGLSANATLQRLTLAWNGLENEGAGAIGEVLSVNMGLKLLDLSSCRIGAEACLMLAEGLKANIVLEVLLLNGNTFGDAGARHLMNALNANKSLQFLGLQGSNINTTTRDSLGEPAEFNAASPDGSYTINLGVRAERVVAIQLAELDRANDSDLMRNIRVDGKPVASCTKADWPALLPVRGILTCDFISHKMRRVMRVIDQKKFNSLIKQFHLTTMSDKERLALVEMFTPFTYLLCAQVATVLKTFSMGLECQVAAAVMLSRTCDAETSIHLITEAITNHDVKGFLDILRWYYYYRYSNPTGHYELNLTRTTHQHIANRLKDVAYSEPEGMNWINMIYDTYSTIMKLSKNCGPPPEWHSLIPCEGLLVVDYVSTVQHPEAVAIGDKELWRLLKERAAFPFETEFSFAVSSQLSYGEGSALIASLRRESCGVHLSCGQVKMIQDCFKACPHRIEVVVIFYNGLVDKENLWNILYGMNGLEQACLVHRLGPANVFNPKHPSLHYVLDLNNPSHEEVAKKLVNMAVASGELPNFWNIRLRGQLRNVTENLNMWGMLTADSFTPFLEFDFIGADGWEALGKTEKEVAALGVGDRLELRTKQAVRLELCRKKQLHPYFPVHRSSTGASSTNSTGENWRSHMGLMQPHVDKPPWLASWDRTMRTLVRYEQRCGEIQGASPLEDVYHRYCKSGEGLTGVQLDQLLKEHGYSKSEVPYYQQQYEEALQARNKQPPPQTPTRTSSSGGAGAPGGISKVASQGRPTPRGNHPRSPSQSLDRLLSPREGQPGRPLSAQTSNPMPAPSSSTMPRPTPSSQGSIAEKVKKSSASGEEGLKGLSYDEFISIFLEEPPRNLKLKDVAAGVTNVLAGSPGKQKAGPSGPGPEKEGKGRDKDGSTGRVKAGSQSRTETKRLPKKKST